jgi:tetratricopeptide (TPR) repeat protein
MLTMQFRQSSARRSLRLYMLLLVVPCSGLVAAPAAWAEDPPALEAPSPESSAPDAADEPATAAPAAATDAPETSASSTATTEPAVPDATEPAASAEAAPVVPEDPTAVRADKSVSGAATTEVQPAEQVQSIGEVLGTDDSELDQIAVQIEAREYDAALQALGARLSELESSPDNYNPALIRPLTLLGDANMGKGAFVEALRDYQRATHLARVNAGLKSPDQVPTVYREASAYKALGQYVEANDREEYAYQLLEDRSAPNDPALLPALYRLANWYVATSNPYPARDLYRRALEVHDANGEGNTPAVIPALQGIALTYRSERFPGVVSTHAPVQAMSASVGPANDNIDPSELANVASNFPEGEAALAEIVKIRKQTPDTDPVKTVEAVLDLADWYTLFLKPDRADALYAHGYQLLAQIPNGDPASYFARPKLLYMPDPGLPRRNGTGVEGESLPGYVEVVYDVTTMGEVRNLDTVAADPPDLMEIRVRRAVRMSRYRPALVDGVAVPQTGVTHRHEFRYWAEPEDEPEDQPAGTSDESEPEVVKQ